MPTEEQTQYNVFSGVYGGGTEGFGQLLTISNRRVIKLAFPLSKINSPTGSVTFIIRLANSPFTVISSKVWGNASALPIYPIIIWEEVEFDDPQNVNALVIIGFRFSGGDASNAVVAHFQNTDVKADELQARHNGTVWYQSVGDDQAYRYTYTTPKGYSQALFIG